MSDSIWYLSFSDLLSLHHLQAHLCCCRWHYFVLFFLAEDYSIVSMYNIFFHASVNGHWGCFHVLAIVSSAAVNMGPSPHLDLSFTSEFLPAFCSALHSLSVSCGAFLSPGWCLNSVHLKSSALSRAFLSYTPASAEGCLRANWAFIPECLLPRMLSKDA